jgi:uncharacterized protein YdaU (DUF1376 family)
LSTSEKVDAWMPLWIGEYLADTMALTRDQHGGYLLLLFAYWRNKGPLADDAEELAAIARATPAEWKKLGPRLARFFEVRDGLWIHTRADKELERAGANRRTKSAKAAAGGAGRWGSDDDASERGRHLRAQRLSEARAKGTHTAMEWEAMKAYHGMRCVRCGCDGEIVKDHILPIYQGGSDSIENIQPLCRKCNASKGPEASDLRKAWWRDAMSNAFNAGIQEGIGGHPNAFPPPSPSPSSPIGEDINDASGERPKYPPEFEAAWQAYPDRPGDSKANAHKAWAARRKGGVTAEVLLAGAQRYAAFCTASATEPQYVKQAATFFGPGEHYLADWTPVARSQPAANQPRRDARDAWLSGIGSTLTTGEPHAEPDQRTVDVEARFVG